MSIIWLVQCLCPHRHCIFTSYYEEGRGDFDMATKSAATIFRAHENFCLLCHGTRLIFEGRQSRFASLAELGAAMAEELQRQVPQRERMLRSGLSWENWPSGLRWNFDHLLRDEGPVLTRTVERTLR
jgi:hypothetical protein